MSTLMVKQGNKLGDIRESLEESAVGKMHVLGERGDTVVTWDPTETDEAEAVHREFDSLMARNFIAFSVPAEGGAGEQIKEFDPDAEKLLVIPPMAGGSEMAGGDGGEVAEGERAERAANLENEAMGAMATLVSQFGFTEQDLMRLVSDAMAGASGGE